MSESIFETFTDERGNISVRISKDVQVLTCEEAECIEAEYKRIQAENAKLRELVRLMVRRHTPISPCKNIPYGECPVKDECDQEDALMRELGVEVD